MAVQSTGSSSDDHVIKNGIIHKAERSAWRKNFEEQWQGELRELSKKASTLLISSEHLQSRLDDKQSIVRLKQLLDKTSNNYSIIVYLRRQDKAAVSRYSTALRAGFTPKTVLPTNTREKSTFYNYQNLVDRWSGVFGKENIKIRIYGSNDFIGGDLLYDFSETARIKADGFVKPQHHNEKLSAPVQDAILLFNRGFSTKTASDKTNKSRQILLKQLWQHLPLKYPGPSKLPPRKSALDFYGIFKRSNNQLAETYLGRSQLFEEDFTEYPCNAADDSLNRAVIADMLAFIAEHSTLQE